MKDVIKNNFEIVLIYKLCIYAYIYVVSIDYVIFYLIKTDFY